MVRKLVLMSTAVALAVTPLATAQARADVQRSSAPVEQKNDFAANSTWVFIAGIAVVVAGILLLSEDDDPVSA